MNAHPVDDSGSSHRSPRRRLPYIAGGFVSAIFILSGAISWVLAGFHFPSVNQVTSRRVIVLESADGRDLFQRGQLQLAPVAANDMPPDVINAVLSIEDRHFYQHGALDYTSMLRALKQNIEAGKIVAGGSTITQQLVKTLFLGPERTYRRKIQEAAIAIWLERHLTKDEILTSYLNNVYLGSGATGFPAAARVYFDKDVRDLSVPEDLGRRLPWSGSTLCRGATVGGRLPLQRNYQEVASSYECNRKPAQSCARIQI